MRSVTVAALALLWILTLAAVDGLASWGGPVPRRGTSSSSSTGATTTLGLRLVGPNNQDNPERPPLLSLTRLRRVSLSASSSSSSSPSTNYDFDTSFLWNRGLNFGKGRFKFYSGFDAWMGPFPEKDRQAYPQIFQLPRGLYEVTLAKPLGIVFEEIDVGRGLYVQDLVDNGNALLSGKVQVGDVLVGMTAVKIVGAKYERRMIPARKFDFDTMVGAVNSNDPRWGCDNVILMLERPGEADQEEVDAFLRFFEPPFDNPWKQQQ